MIAQITVGAASLMGALVAGTALIRWAVTPAGSRDRYRDGDTIEIPLAGLQPWWPEPAPGALAAQAFAWCPLCQGEVAVVLHREGAHRCDRNHVTITRAGGGC